MEVAATAATSTTLPLALRLRRAALIALLLGLWAPVKILWEQHIAREQDLLRYNGAPMTRQLRDELGQGLTIGVLSGMRSVVADLVWLNVVTAWMDQDWFKMGGYINLATALQPRAPVFWDMGGWQLAWNASIAAQHDVKTAQPPAAPEGPRGSGSTAGSTSTSAASRTTRPTGGSGATRASSTTSG
ncbi:MAG: hypothetical protein WDO13_04815 [Verrucomicrobiota bacterium]